MTKEEIGFVKEGLKHCAMRVVGKENPSACFTCPYYQSTPHAAPCGESLVIDAYKAIEFLEECNDAGKPAMPGKWDVWYRPHNGDYIEYTCSLCGRPSDVREKYCPNCGAPMEEPETVPKGV